MRMRERLAEWHPSRITGGASVYPLVVLFGLNAVDELDRAAFAVLVPEIRDAFDLDLQGILTVVALVGIAGLALEIPIAHLADRARRTRIAIVGAAVWAGFSVLTGLATNIWWLGIARAGSGVGRVVNTPTHNSLLADYYEVDVRAKVYGVHRAANAVGQFLGPATAGVLAYAFGWRTPFFVFVVPTAVFILLARRLREPVRGSHERRSMGADDEVIATEEVPPSFAEAWRLVWQVRTLRRIWYSLPFLAASFVGLGSLVSIYYEEEFGLDEAQRGFLAAFAEPGQLVGLAVGIPIATRLLARDPGAALRFLSVAGIAVSGAWVAMAVAPMLWLAVAAHVLLAAVFALLAPGIYASLSLAIPPRARALGFSVGSLWIMPGLVILPIVGGFADAWGIRPAMLLMVPVFLLGSFLLSSAGLYVAGDIHRVRTSTTALADVRAARERGEAKLLLLRGVDVQYDGVQVLFGIDLEVDEGEVIALLGTNGAGKSTLLKAISGVLEPSAGAVIFDGRDMTFAPPHEIVARGVVQMPGGKGTFPSLSVRENLDIAGWLFRRDRAAVADASERVLELFPVLRKRLGEPAGNLSGGQQQMLALAQAFIARPRLLMIDELSLGLAPAVVEQLLEVVRQMRERGTTIILVEQSVNVALTVAETAYFMEKGEIRFRGPTADLLDRPDILRSVFLHGAGASFTAGAAAADPAATVARRRRQRRVEDGAAAEEAAPLEVDGVCRSFGGVRALVEVSFTLGRREILGVLGPNGAGKTTLFDVISGFVPSEAGTIRFQGRDITRLAPDARARLGLGRSFQDTRLFPALTVTEVIAVALEREIVMRDPVAAILNLPAVAASEARIAARVDELVELTGLGAFRNKFVSELSTGSRRVVDLACVMAHRPTVLLFDEPSSGIAQREAEALGPVLVRIRDETGASLLVIEHDMSLLASIADRALALELGRVVATGPPKDVLEHPQVVTAYLGGSAAAIARSGTAVRSRRRRPVTAD